MFIRFICDIDAWWSFHQEP